MKRVSLLRVLLVAALGACTDVGAPPPVQFSGGVIPLEDPNINPDDSWITFDAAITTVDTIDLTQSITDPETGQAVSQLVLTSGPDTLYSIEAGYDYDGILRVNMSADATPGDPTVDATAGESVVLLSQGTLYRYDASGALIPLPGAPDSASTVDPLGLLGTDLLYGSVTDGVLVDSLRPNASVTAAEGAGSVNHRDVTRGYATVRGRTVLREVRSRMVAEAEGVRRSSVAVFKLEGLNWHENPERDRWRARHRAERGAQGRVEGRDATSSQLSAQLPPVSLAVLPDCGDDPECEGGGGGGGGGGGTTTTTLIWQHGLFSNGGAWNRMRAWVEPQFSTYPIAESLNSTDRAENQATDLIGRLEASGHAPGIVIGHSLGGLVGRRAAQRRPDLISGVLTVGTPNRGAYLALTSRLVVRSGLDALLGQLWAGCSGPYMDAGCAVAWFGLHFAEYALVAYAADAAVPASQDLLPTNRVSNPFLEALNSATEIFPRAGIQSYANKRWAFVRQLGDWQCNPEDPACGGRAWASYTAWAYTAFKVCSVIAAVTGNENSFFWCTYIYRGMDAVDSFWTRMTTTFLDRTDGIVQGSSQLYPGTTNQFQIFGGDSHNGEVKSNLVKDQMIIALQNVFNVH